MKKKAYWFRHSKHTNNETEFIGQTAEEALSTLQTTYSLDLEEMFDFCMDGYIWEGTAN